MSGSGDPVGFDSSLLRRGIAGDTEWSIDAERVVRIALNPDDELRNLQVVLCYSLTSARMAERISWSAPPGNLRARTNANWFTMAQWAVLTVGRNMRMSELPHRFATLPDIVRRRLTPWVLSVRSSDDRRVAASLSYGQVVVFCSIYRSLLFHSHFADGLPMSVPPGPPPRDLPGGPGEVQEQPPEAWSPTGLEIEDDSAVGTMLKRWAAEEEQEMAAEQARDCAERETVLALAAQMGAHVLDISPDAYERKAFYELVLNRLADLCDYGEQLDEAFVLYQEAARWAPGPVGGEADGGRKPADLIFDANLRIAAIEQVVLDRAVSAVIDQLPRHMTEQLEGRMSTFAERTLRLPRFIAQLNSAKRLSGVSAVATDVWSRVMTDQVMVVALPTETLRLGRNIPSKDWRKPFYAPDLMELSPEAQAMFDRFDRSLGDGRGAAAGDWRRFDDRMNFAANLLRSRQQDSSLFWQPFVEEDMARLWNGQYPTRRLEPFEQAVRSPSTVFADDFDENGARTFTCDARVASHREKSEKEALDNALEAERLRKVLDDGDDDGDGGGV
jgi:hypothetical protein